MINLILCPSLLDYLGQSSSPFAGDKNLVLIFVFAVVHKEYIRPFAFYSLTDVPKDCIGWTYLKSLLELKALMGECFGEENLVFQSLQNYQWSHWLFVSASCVFDLLQDIISSALVVPSDNRPVFILRYEEPFLLFQLESETGTTNSKPLMEWTKVKPFIILAGIKF